MSPYFSIRFIVILGLILPAEGLLLKVREDADNVRVRLAPTAETRLVEATINGTTSTVRAPGPVAESTPITVSTLALGTDVVFTEFRVLANGNREEVATLTLTTGAFSGKIEDGESLTWNSDRMISDDVNEVSEGATLTVTAGVTLRTTDGNPETVDIDGTVNLLGSAAQPVVLDDVTFSSEFDFSPEAHRVENITLQGGSLELHHPTFVGRMSGEGNIGILLEGIEDGAELKLEDIEFDLNGSLNYRGGEEDGPAFSTLEISNCRGTLNRIFINEFESDIFISENAFIDTPILLQNYSEFGEIKIFDNIGGSNCPLTLNSRVTFFDPPAEITGNTMFSEITILASKVDLEDNTLRSLTIRSRLNNVRDNTFNDPEGDSTAIFVGEVLSNPAEGEIPLMEISGNRITGHRKGLVLNSGHGATVEKNRFSNCEISLELAGIAVGNFGDFSTSVIRDNFFEDARDQHVQISGDCEVDQCVIPFGHPPTALGSPPSFEAGTNIAGGGFLAGNSWDDFNGIDENGDGISDTPNVFFNENGIRYEDPHPLSGGAIIVNSTGDEADPPAGTVTLRSAILEANDSGGPDRIIFDIPGISPHIIRPVTRLPSLRQLTIDGSTDSRIEIDGSLLTAANRTDEGLRVFGQKVTLINLSIYHFPGPGIFMNGGSGHEVRDCFIGTNELFQKLPGNGSASGGRNQFAGINVNNTDDVLITNCVIGNNDTAGILATGQGTQASQRLTVTACQIGIALDGPTATRLLRNDGPGILIESGEGHIIGGLENDEGNIISANTHGIHLDSLNFQNIVTGTLIQSNQIGALGDLQPGAIGVESDLFGSAFGNLGFGILLEGAQETIIGPIGTGSLARDRQNVIAFNRDGGVRGSRNNPATIKNVVRQNSIFSNGPGISNPNPQNDPPGLGIDWAFEGPTENDSGDLSADQDNSVNFPTLSFQEPEEAGDGIDTFNADLDAKANTTYLIDIYLLDECDLSGFGEGATSLTSGQLTTDANGKGRVSLLSPDAIDLASVFSATATELNVAGSPVATSEFAPCLGVLIVNVETDESDPDLDDGIFDVDPVTPGPQLSLRAAIENANLLPGRQTIIFDDGVEEIILDQTSTISIEETLNILGAGQREDPVTITTAGTRDRDTPILTFAADAISLSELSFRTNDADEAGRDFNNAIAASGSADDCTLTNCTFRFSASTFENIENLVFESCTWVASPLTLDVSNEVILRNADVQGTLSEVTFQSCTDMKVTGSALPGGKIILKNSSECEISGNIFSQSRITELEGSSEFFFDVGIIFTGSGTEQNIVSANRFLISGDFGGSNLSWIRIQDGASNNQIGAGPGTESPASLGNRFETNPAIEVSSDCQGNAIRKNSFAQSITFEETIDLGQNGPTENDELDVDGGANLGQNFPTFTSLYGAGTLRDTIVGTMSAVPNTRYTLDFFSARKRINSARGGGDYIDSATVLTDASGKGNYALALAENDLRGAICATATDPAGNTSEVSPYFNHYRVNSGADTGDPVPNDGFSQIPGQAGAATTLRAAIEAAQEISADTLIDFDLAAAARIEIQEALPLIAQTKFIFDGRENRGGKPFLDGRAFAGGTAIRTIAEDDIEFHNLTFVGFTVGIELDSPSRAAIIQSCDFGAPFFENGGIGTGIICRNSGHLIGGPVTTPGLNLGNSFQGAETGIFIKDTSGVTATTRIEGNLFGFDPGELGTEGISGAGISVEELRGGLQIVGNAFSECDQGIHIGIDSDQSFPGPLITGNHFGETPLPNSGAMLRANRVGIDLGIIERGPGVIDDPLIIQGNILRKNTEAGIRVISSRPVEIGGTTATPGVAPGNIISGSFAGIEWRTASPGVVRGNLIGVPDLEEGGNTTGIAVVSNDSRLEISNNRVSGNGDIGINVFESPLTKITNNFIRDNGDFGIRVINTEPIAERFEILGNDIQKHNQDAISISGSDFISVGDGSAEGENTLSISNRRGIVVRDSDAIRISRNSIQTLEKGITLTNSNGGITPPQFVRYDFGPSSAGAELRMTLPDSGDYVIEVFETPGSPPAAGKRFLKFACDHGKTFIGSLPFNATSAGPTTRLITLPLPSGSNRFLTATLTEVANDRTSEFSLCAPFVRGDRDGDGVPDSEDPEPDNPEISSVSATDNAGENFPGIRIEVRDQPATPDAIQSTIIRTQDLETGLGEFGLELPQIPGMKILGLFTIDAVVSPPGSAVEVAIKIPESFQPRPNVFFKVNGLAGEAFEFTPYNLARFTDGEVIITIVDGGPGDLDGLVNGKIKDPGALVFDPRIARAAPPVSVAREGTINTITVTSEIGKTYTLEASNDLKNFEALGSSRPGTGTPLNFIEETNAGTRFYRVKIRE